MRIAILTVPFNNNYGGYLQAYALMNVLRSMGHTPTIIMRRQNLRHVSIGFRLKFFVKALYKTIMNRKWNTCFYNVENDFHDLGVNILPFVFKYIAPQTKFLYTTNDLQEECEGRFDAFVVGSDQVWRSIYVPGMVKDFYLDFTNGWNVKRVAYAASFGTDTPEYTEDEQNVCGELIKNFDAVSVREFGAFQVFQNFKWSPKNLTQVLDPTMLLNVDEYIKFLVNEPNVTQGNLFCYVLDKNNQVNHIISEIQKKNGLGLYQIADIQKTNQPLPSIEFWLAAIRNADYVITDSFHGTVFSILFHKPFVVCVNKTRGADRFDSLLNMFDLQNRMVGDVVSLPDLLNSNINWQVVDQKIEQMKKVSYCFLSEFLN